MRAQTLTRNSYHDKYGRLCHTYEWMGKEHLVCDSCQNMLLVIELFADEELGETDKLDILLNMLFPDPAATIEAVSYAAFGDFLAHVLWEACGLDIQHKHEQEYRHDFDWQEDAARIQASFLKAYGIRWDKAAHELSFNEVCALLGELFEDENTTPFQQAVYYRTAKPPKRNKNNGDYCDAWEKARRHYRLKGTNNDADYMEMQNNTAKDMFAALAAIAKVGGE